jgi:TolB protein
LAGATRAKDVRLTKPRRNVQPTWSPDGRRFAFMNFGFLFVQDARGRGHQIAGDDNHVDQSPAWSPDGRRIAFVAGAHGSRLMTIRPDGKVVRALTPGGFDLNPAWSPDGGLVAFEAVDQVLHRSAIYVIDSKGGGRRLLVENASDPSWSPDGRSIAFVRQLTVRQRNLFVIGTDGAGERQLTAGAGYDTQPAWSPDGTRIAFTRGAPEQTDTDIAVVRPDGTGMHIVRGSARAELDPTWRPRAARRRGKGPCNS